MVKIVEFVFNVLIYIINTVIVLFSKVLSLILGVLPDSPFSSLVMTYDLSISKYISYLAWLIPIGQIVSITTVWLTCMIIYFGYSIVMRWIKLID